MLVLACLVTCAILMHLFACGPQLTIRTQHGMVEGHMDEGSHDVLAWHGIPFAAPPVGPLRWVSPQPPASWTGIYNATYERSMCTQPMQHAPYMQGEEDCLYLNVFAPAVTTTHALPVFVYIFGGGE